MKTVSTEALALHTAARRYCMEAHAVRCAEYEEIIRQGRDREKDGYHYSAEARRTFPRYNVLAAILEEVETLASETLGTIEDTRELLSVAALANNAFTRGAGDEVSAAAIRDERDAFVRFIRGFSTNDVGAVIPLPYHRVLASTEAKQLWDALERRWGIKAGYWYPLTHATSDGLVAWDADAFHDAVPTSRLCDALGNRGILRVWELREFGAQYECDASIFEPVYNGAEGYWSSGPLDWIVYASHESSITIGGWLTDKVKDMWEDWPSHIYGRAG